MDEKVGNEYEWKPGLVIPRYLVLSITDRGMEETCSCLGDVVEKDDLRVAIELSTGVPILLNCASRIIIRSNGDLEIQTLEERPL